MWDVLGIAPTDDLKAIRRAYAARLRQIDPDRDRAGFARLRHALESALARAARPRRPAPERPPPEPLDDLSRLEPDHDGAPIIIQLEESDPDTDVHLPPITPAARDEPPPVPPPAADTTSDRTLLIGLESALQSRDAQEAGRLYIRGSATGALPLGDTERMLARLFTVALGDTRFSPAQFRALARTFGWDRPLLDSAVVSEVRQRVSARLAAEDWYDNLAEVARRRRLTGRKRIRAARLLLRRIRGWALFRIHRPTLQAFLDEYAGHEAWLRDRIDPAWVATLKRRMRRREISAGAILALFLGAMLLNAVIVFVGGALGLLQDGSPFGLLVMIPIGVVLFGLIRLLLRNIVAAWRRRP